MDDRPLYIFSMDAMRASDPAVLERFGRTSFGRGGGVLAEAGEEFVRLIAARVQPGRLTAAAREQFVPVLVASIGAIVRDKVNERLTSALAVANPSTVPIAEGASDDASAGDGVVTTEDEIGGFRIVQAIAARHVDPKRIVIRDSKSYCAILLDDNNRKSLARLHFNSPTTRYVGTFVGKEETRHPVFALTDLYKLEAAIVARIAELEG